MQIGDRLNQRYTLTAHVGSGSMGDVYQATDSQSGETVAVKVLDRKLTLDPEMVERFKREGEALRQLRHRHIVSFVDTFQHERQQVIVMEYVSGGSLHQFIRRGPLPVEQVRQIAIDLCDALICAHRLNIIHRDLKPENVLLAPDGTPKLTDFGVARLVSEGTRLTGTGTQIGTPYYMSPEAWQGQPLDAQADIWSLGIMLYEMLTGEVPFGGDTLIAVMNKVLTSPLPDLKKLRPETPASLVKIVRRMLERDRVKRYQSLREAGWDLERATVTPTPAPTVVSPASVAGPMPAETHAPFTIAARGGWKRWALVGAGLALAVVLCLLAAGGGVLVMKTLGLVAAPTRAQSPQATPADSSAVAPVAMLTRTVEPPTATSLPTDTAEPPTMTPALSATLAPPTDNPSVTPAAASTNVASYPELWAASAHADAQALAFRDWDTESEVPAGCARCHTATGLPMYLHNNGTLVLSATGSLQVTGIVGLPPSNGLDCSTCHDEAAGFPATYAVTSVTFPSGKKVTFSTEKDDQGNLKPVGANLCLECHQGRESTVSLNRYLAAFKGLDTVDSKISFRNIHYFAAGATLFGTEAQGAYEYDGQTYNGYNAKHAAVGLGTCTDCHDAHGLNVKNDRCATCHAGIKSAGDIRMLSDSTDWNGNKDAKEPIKAEIATFQERLYGAIQKYGADKSKTPIVYDVATYPYYFVAGADGKPAKNDQGANASYNAWTPRLLKAAHNYQCSVKDPGTFAHNPMYTMQFLYDSVKDLGGDVTGLTRP